MTALDELCCIPFHEAEAPARARILNRLADTELFAALITEPSGDIAELQIFDLPDGPAALACDSEDRLAAFVGGPVVHLAAPGRALAAALAEKGQGLLINPGLASQMLLDADTLRWLGQALRAAPETEELGADGDIFAARPEVVAVLAEPLAQRLDDMFGLVAQAALVGIRWTDGRSGHLIQLTGTEAANQPAIAKALSEMLAFLPEVEGGVDIAFSDRALPATALVIRPHARPSTESETPKRDPNAPPRLR